MRLFASILSFTSLIMSKTSTLPLRIVTFNIRYAATSLGGEEKPWATRAPLVINQLKEDVASAPSGTETIIGLQEVLFEQLNDIKTGLGSSWSYIGVGRKDGKQAGEFNPIWYQPSALNLLFNGTTWLSPFPDSPIGHPPSGDWEAGSKRMVNVGVFEHAASGKRIIAANTHLDDASLEARREGIKIALNYIQEVQGTWGPLAVSLTGDFNSEPEDPKDAYATLEKTGYMQESYEMATESQRFGEYYTFTGFKPDKERDRRSRIDFIWLGPATGKWAVDRYEVLPNRKDGVYLSDHRASYTDARIIT
ncbi:endonuclease/exonuclease/phosphatase family protein [Xylariales sp. AK1849]|nr:endonuclease/exonuclease/phosphatase family protein [Xylariales sp. AK1849]